MTKGAGATVIQVVGRNTKHVSTEVWYFAPLAKNWINRYAYSVGNGYKYSD